MWLKSQAIHHVIDSSTTSLKFIIVTEGDKLTIWYIIAITVLKCHHLYLFINQISHQD